MRREKEMREREFKKFRRKICFYVTKCNIFQLKIQSMVSGQLHIENVGIFNKYKPVFIFIKIQEFILTSHIITSRIHVWVVKTFRVVVKNH